MGKAKESRRVSARYWNDSDQQWKYMGFETMEDLEEFMTDTGIKFHNITTRKAK